MNSLALVPLVLILVQGVKQTNYINPRFLPLIALVLGFAGSLILGEVTSLETTLTAIVSGLASIGLWEFSSKTVAGK